MPSSAGMPSAPIGIGAAKQPDFVDEIGRDEGRRHPRAALHHQPGDALLGQRVQHGGEIEPRRRLVVVGTRITCAPAAPSFIAAGASGRFDVITHSGVSRAE